MKSALEKLENLFKSCQETRSLKEGVYLRAKEFLESLPENLLEHCSLYVISDQDILIEWRNCWKIKEKRKIISVCITDSSLEENEELFFVSNMFNNDLFADVLPIKDLLEHLNLLKSIKNEEIEEIKLFLSKPNDNPLLEIVSDHPIQWILSESEKFIPNYRYDLEHNLLSIHFKEDPCFSDLVTRGFFLLRNLNTKEIVGCKLSGVDFLKHQKEQEESIEENSESKYSEFLIEMLKSPLAENMRKNTEEKEIVQWFKRLEKIVNQPFAPYYDYDRDHDNLYIKLKDGDYWEKQIEKGFWVFISLETEEIIGCELNGLKLFSQSSLWKIGFSSQPQE